jgi:hypothetical protein
MFILELQQKGIYRTLELKNVKLANNLGEISDNICGRSYILKRKMACCVFEFLLMLGDTKRWIKTFQCVF